MRTRFLAPVALLAALALAAAGCGGGDDNSSNNNSSSSNKSSSSKSSGATNTTSSGGAAAGGGSSVKLSAPASGALQFDTKSINAKAGKVTIDFSNPSQVPHAVEVEGNGVEKETKTITNGNASVTVDLKKGKYEFYCPVDGHRQAGMQGTLTVG
jgi:plastocyanin